MAPKYQACERLIIDHSWSRSTKIATVESDAAISDYFRWVLVKPGNPEPNWFESLLLNMKSLEINGFGGIHKSDADFEILGYIPIRDILDASVTRYNDCKLEHIKLCYLNHSKHNTENIGRFLTHMAANEWEKFITNVVNEGKNRKPRENSIEDDYQLRQLSMLEVSHYDTKNRRLSEKMGKILGSLNAVQLMIDSDSFRKHQNEIGSNKYFKSLCITQGGFGSDDGWGEHNYVALHNNIEEIVSKFTNSIVSFDWQDNDFKYLLAKQVKKNINIKRIFVWHKSSITTSDRSFDNLNPSPFVAMIEYIKLVPTVEQACLLLTIGAQWIRNTQVSFYVKPWVNDLCKTLAALHESKDQLTNGGIKYVRLKLKFVFGRGERIPTRNIVKSTINIDLTTMQMKIAKIMVICKHS